MFKIDNYWVSCKQKNINKTVKTHREEIRSKSVNLL